MQTWSPSQGVNDTDTRKPDSFPHRRIGFFLASFLIIAYVHLGTRGRSLHVFR